MLTAIMAGVALAFMAGDFVYHKWLERKESKEGDPSEMQLPRVDDGAPIPLIYGRCRVRAPILAWVSAPVADLDEAYPGGLLWRMDMFFVLGIGFDDGAGTNRIHGMWVGEHAMDDGVVSPGFTTWSALTGDGGYEDTVNTGLDPPSDVDFVGGQAEFLNGNAAQALTDNTDPLTLAGERMMDGGIAATAVPGFRGYVSVFLGHVTDGFKWFVGGATTVQAYSFEVSSYRDSSDYPGVAIYAQVGQDSNPMNALWDLLKAKFGKLGYDESLLDLTSFREAAATLYSESHGYSRCIDDAQEADEIIQEILRQIDATLFEDPTTGTVKIKLIRNDYDPNDIVHIHKDNCIKLTNFAAGGWTGIPNKVRIVYPNREKDYQDDSESAQNPANAVGQEGQVREMVIQMPGVTNAALAARLAARELAAFSRPLIKCRAIVDRSFSTVRPGDAVKLTWTNPDIAGLVFRVAIVDRGTLENGAIGLDLIQDFYYVYRGRTPKFPHFGGPLIDGALTQG